MTANSDTQPPRNRHRAFRRHAASHRAAPPPQPVPGLLTAGSRSSQLRRLHGHSVLRPVVCGPVAAAEYPGLNRTDHRCLDIIEHTGPLPASDLARMARLSAKAITATIDRLENAGYAQRVADPADRRKVLVAITSDEHRRGEDAWAPVVQGSRQMLQRYIRAGLELLTDYLGCALQILDLHSQRLRAAASTSPANPSPTTVGVTGED